jgi:hypothetical protein
MLHDDTTAAIRAWIDRRTGELPAGFGRDVRAWLVVLLDGDARTRPRSHATVHFHFGGVRPFIECWAATRGHLRGDHLQRRRHRPGAATRPPALQRHHRAALAVPVRQTTRPDVRRPHRPPARRPGRRAHRAADDRRADPGRPAGGRHSRPAPGHRPGSRARRPARAIRELTLEDIDLPSRRISIAGHRQPLGELTRDALLAWLRYRRATWPDTANRHVLITRKSALGTGPVSASYLADYLGRHQRGISLEHIRRDRILAEALATGADPLHLALVFNIDHTNAMAYASAARNLLTGPVPRDES